MMQTKCRPTLWKEEFVTAIPKKAIPEGLDDLRNISCTALLNKAHESFVLEWACEQVGMRLNQLGGMKGAGTEHYLVQHSKAFNCLYFGLCLPALASKGASTEIISIIASFLTSKTMMVKVGQEILRPCIVLG